MDTINHVKKAVWFYHVLPFAVFMVFTALGGVFVAHAHIIYAAKTAVVGLVLLVFVFKGMYSELVLSYDSTDWLWGITAGIATLVIWVAPEGIMPPLGDGKGFDPHSFGVTGLSFVLVVFVRVFGASVVVPVTEELFWRSFLSRYLVNPDFGKVPLGKYTTFSFVATAICFGLEHRRIVVGVIAGIIYNYLFLRRKNLFTPLLAHAVTNLGLAIYVLYTGNYGFW